MAIISIREINLRDILRVVGYGSIRQHIVHQTPRDAQTFDSVARIIRYKIATPLIVDIIAPAGIDKPIYGALDEKITKVKGI